jgi:hypothetical protein
MSRVKTKNRLRAPGAGRKRVIEVSDEERRQVEILIGGGMSQDDIARAIGRTLETLRRHFVEELRCGRAKSRAAVIVAQFETALKGNASAQDKYLGKSQVGTNVPADPLPARPLRLGKKDVAQLAASRAGEGSEWGDDLRTPTTH